MKNSLIFIPFNALLEDVCNYSEETIKILSRQNTVVGIALGNPFSPWRDIASFLKGSFFKRVSPSYSVLRPVMFVPFQRVEAIKRFNIFLNILLLNIFYFFYKQKILWFFEPNYQSLFFHFLSYKKSIYDCIDFFSSIKDLEKEHNFLIKNVQYVFTNSQILKKKYSSMRSDIHAVEAGFALSGMPRTLATKRKNISKKKTFFFMGSMGWRMDFSFVKKLVEKRKGDRFIFIGPQYFDLKNKKDISLKRQFDQLIKKRKIEWIPELPRKKMIEKVAAYDVGVIPYSSKMVFNKFSFPMKAMEYFYLGVPVVSTSIEELKRFPEDIYIPEEQGWRNLNKFLEGETPLKQRKRRKIAFENSWDKKVHSIMKVLES